MRTRSIVLLLAALFAMASVAGAAAVSKVNPAPVREAPVLVPTAGSTDDACMGGSGCRICTMQCAAENINFLNWLGYMPCSRVMSPAAFGLEAAGGFTNCDIIYLGWMGNSCPGTKNALWNNRFAIQTFVENGGGIAAFSQWQGGNPMMWGWVPPVDGTPGSPGLTGSGGDHMSSVAIAGATSSGQFGGHCTTEGNTARGTNAISFWGNTQHNHFTGHNAAIWTEMTCRDSNGNGVCNPPGEPWDGFYSCGEVGPGAMVVSGTDPDWHTVVGFSTGANVHGRAMINYACCATDCCTCGPPPPPGGSCDTAAIEAKMDAQEIKLDNLEAKADTQEGKLDTVEAKLDAAEAKLDTLLEMAYQELRRDVYRGLTQCSCECDDEGLDDEGSCTPESIAIGFYDDEGNPYDIGCLECENPLFLIPEAEGGLLDMAARIVQEAIEEAMAAGLDRDTDCAQLLLDEALGAIGAERYEFAWGILCRAFAMVSK